MHEPLFIPAPFFFLRSPYWALEDFHQILKQESWMEAILNLYDTHELLQEAIAIASPSLYSALKKRKPEQTEALSISLLNYALRMATRSIPFGLFSFVGTGSWGSKTDISFNLNKVRKRARPDMSWVYNIIQKLYQDEDTFPFLSVRTNPLLRETQDRFFLSYLRCLEKDDATPTQNASIRATCLVKTALALAKKPRDINTLSSEILKILPELDPLKIQDVLRNLLSQQFLLPSIIPSLLSMSPFEDLLPYLPNGMALGSIIEKMKAYNQCPLGKGLADLEELHKEMETIAPTKAFLQVDTVYPDSSLYLSTYIHEELSQAAALLWKISPRQALSPMLQAYHAKFMEKYGTHRTVPLLEMLSEDKGLGSFETTSLRVPEKKPSSFTQQLEKWLHQKWEECIRNHQEEIILSDTTVDHLFSLANEAPPQPQNALPSMDLFFKIFADSSEQVDRRNFLLLFVQPTWQGGSSMGRFMDLLSEKAKMEFKEWVLLEEQLEKKALFVEVSYWPVTGHNANVATHPCFRNYRLDIQAKEEDSCSLSLEDIYVGITHDRFYLTLQDGKREVIVRIGNLLNPSFAPIPLQFMREVTQSKYHLLHPFYWGSGKKHAVFLPRVRYGRTILTPAQWNLDADLFYREELQKISSKFASWADLWKLPRYCFLVQGDQQLLMDRLHPAHIKEISLKLKKGESLHFVENIGTPWIQSERGHHLCEIVVPFLKNPVHIQKTPLESPSYIPIPKTQRLKLLGSEWTYIKLYLGEEGINRFLTQHLAPFADQIRKQENVAGWFFVRYRDPEPHLRFRMRLTEFESLSPLILKLKEQALKWIEAGLIQDMVFTTYEREVERYGGIDLMEPAEVVFCADTLATLSILDAIATKTSLLPEPILHALSLVCFLKGFNLNLSEMTHLLNSTNDSRAELKGFREHKNQLATLLQALEERSSSQELEPLLEASAIRKAGQEFYLAKAQDLSVKERVGIYNSMLHMHANRLGCDSAAERRARLYASHGLIHLERRAALLSPATNLEN